MRNKFVHEAYEAYAYCLEVVDDTEEEIVAREVETEALFAVCAVMTISFAVAEEASVGDEVDLLVECYAYTGHYAYAPCYFSVAAILYLYGVDAEAHVEEELYRTELNEAPTCVGIYGYVVYFSSSIVVVAIAEAEAQIPFVRELVAHFGMDGYACVVVVGAAPCAYFATEINLCVGSKRCCSNGESK